MPVYKDTAANRKLDRVGKTYGYSGPRKATAPKATGGAAAPKASSPQPVAPPRERRGIKKMTMGQYLEKQFSGVDDAYGRNDKPIAEVFLKNAIYDLLTLGEDGDNIPIGDKNPREVPQFKSSQLKSEQFVKSLINYFASSRKYKPSELPKLLPSMDILAPKIVNDMKELVKYPSKKKGVAIEAEMLKWLKDFKPKYTNDGFQGYQTDFIKLLKKKYPGAKFVIKDKPSKDGMIYEGIYVNGKLAGSPGGSSTEKAETNKKIAEMLKK